MTNHNDPINPNAFDSQTWGNAFDKDRIAEINKGLTKREYFAAMAMQGLLLSHQEWTSYESLPDLSVETADALINALNQKK